MLHKLQRKVVCVVSDGRNILKNLSKTLVDEPFVRVSLDLYEVGHGQNRFDLRVAHALFSTYFSGLGHAVPSLY